jgi:hypothetical protein
MRFGIFDNIFFLKNAIVRVYEICLLLHLSRISNLHSYRLILVLEKTVKAFF